jgi:four helix bundle protein
MNKQNLEERLINYSVFVIRFTNTMKSTEASMVLRKQILRSATSVSLNYGESRGAESKKDFIHKLQIVLKELRESHITLRIIQKAELSTKNEEINSLIKEANELISIFVKSIQTLHKQSDNKLA